MADIADAEDDADDGAELFRREPARARDDRRHPDRREADAHADARADQAGGVRRAANSSDPATTASSMKGIVRRGP